MRKIIKPLFMTVVMLFITLTLIEIVLQITFLHLPQTITQRMPQYPERYGINFNTSHGARQYPSLEKVNFEVNKFTGDLYQISCLSPADAQDVDPYIINYQRNDNGFRTPELDSNDVDIVVLGDSFTAAESIVTPYWEYIDGTVSVLGLPGSGTLEQNILLEEFGLQRNPNIIVLAYFAGNDLTDNKTFNDLRLQNLTFADKTHQGRNPLEYLVTFHLLLFVRDTLNINTRIDCHYPVFADTTPSTPIAFYDNMISLFAFDLEEMLNGDAFQITATAIIDTANQAKSIEAEFIFAYIPQKAEIYWNLLNDASQEIIISNLPNDESLDSHQNIDSFRKNVDVQRQLLGSLAQEHGFHFLDFTPFLTESAKSSQPPYFFADTHWNQLGHEIAGNVLSEYISELTLDKIDDS